MSPSFLLVLAVIAAVFARMSRRRETFGFITYIAMALAFYEANHPAFTYDDLENDLYAPQIRISRDWMELDDPTTMLRGLKKILTSRYPYYYEAIDAAWCLLEFALSMLITALVPAALCWCFHLSMALYARLGNFFGSTLRYLSVSLATSHEWIVTGMPGTYPLVYRSTEQDQEKATGPAEPDTPCPSTRERALETSLLEMTLERNILMRQLQQAQKEITEMRAREALSSAAIPTLSTVMPVASVAPIAPVVPPSSTLTMSAIVAVAVILPEVPPGSPLTLIPPATAVAIEPINSPAPPTLTFSTVEEVFIRPVTVNPAPATETACEEATLEREDSPRDESPKDAPDSQSRSDQDMPICDDTQDMDLTGMGEVADDDDTSCPDGDHSRLLDQPMFNVFRDKSSRRPAVVDHDDEEMDDAPRSSPVKQLAIAAAQLDISEVQILNQTQEEQQLPEQMEEVMESEAPAAVLQQPTVPDVFVPFDVECSMIDVLPGEKVEKSEEVCRDDVPPALEVTESEPPRSSPISSTAPLGGIAQPATPDESSQDIKPPAPVPDVSAEQVSAAPMPSEESPETLTTCDPPVPLDATPERAVATTSAEVPSTVSEPSRATSAAAIPAETRKLLRRKPKDPNAMFASRSTIAKRSVNLGAGRKTQYEQEARSSPSSSTAPPRTARDELAPLPVTPQPAANRPRPRPSEEEEDEGDRTHKVPTAASSQPSPADAATGAPRDVAQRRIFPARKNRFADQ
ncbi:hypothetical protein ACHAQA_000431 [Verticillium albo-atrum]